MAVLVPTRNDERDGVRVDHVLHGLLAQTFRDFRIVIRDEGDCGAFDVRTVRQFADLLVAAGIELQYLRAPGTAGIAHSRRELIENAHDVPLLCFVDDDMCLHPEALATLVEVAERHPDFGFVQGSKIEADPTRTYWNDINQLNSSDKLEGEVTRLWFGDSALLLMRREALQNVRWDVVTRYEVDGLTGEDVALSIMIADHHPCFGAPSALGWHLSPRTTRWIWEAPSDLLQLELLRPHVSADTLRRALPHLADYVE